MTLEQLRTYTKYPMEYNKRIRRISRQFYYSNGIYANTVDYGVAIPRLDYVVTTNAMHKTSKKVKQKKNYSKIYYTKLIIN